MIEFINAVSGLTWPGAIAVSSACFSLAIVGYALLTHK